MTLTTSITNSRRDAIARASAAMVRLQRCPEVKEPACRQNDIVKDVQRFTDYEAWDAVCALETMEVEHGLVTQADIDEARAAEHDRVMARLETENRFIFAQEIAQLQAAARHEVAMQHYTADQVSHALQELLPGDETHRPTKRQIMLVELRHQQAGTPRTVRAGQHGDVAGAHAPLGCPQPGGVAKGGAPEAKRLRGTVSTTPQPPQPRVTTEDTNLMLDIENTHKPLDIQNTLDR